MNRAWCRFLWIVGGVALLAFGLALATPILDYSGQEFFKWYQDRSAENLRALQNKRPEEFRTRVILASPFAAIALVVAVDSRKPKTEAKPGRKATAAEP